MADRLRVTDEYRRILQHLHLENLARNGGIDSEKPYYVGTSGTIFPMYVHADSQLRTPKLRKAAAKAISDLARIHFESERPDAVAGGELKDVFFALPVADLLELPFYALRKSGTVVPSAPEGASFYLVSDVNNQGHSLRTKWIPAVQSVQGRVARALFYVDHLEDGIGVLEELRLPHDAVVPLNDRAYGLLRKWGAISREKYASIMERHADRREWERRMLIERPETLIDMLRTPANREKVGRVLARYADFRQDVLSAMERRGFRYDGDR